MESSERKLGRKKRGISDRTELIMRFGELGEKPNDREASEIWKASEWVNQKREIGGILPTIQEEGEAGCVFDQKEIGDLVSQAGRRFRAIPGIGGGQGDLSEQRETDELALGNDELGRRRHNGGLCRYGF